MPSMQAFVDDFGQITVVVNRNFYGGEIKGFYLRDEDGFVGDCLIRYREEHENEIIYSLTAPADLEFGHRYHLHEEHGNSTITQPRFIVKSKRFSELFTYTKDDLGATYHPLYTDFALWAPTAIECYVKVRHAKSVDVYPMKRTEKGVFRYRLPGNHKGDTYVYIIERNGQVVESIDPYGLSSTANSKESAIIDISDLVQEKENALPPLNSATDAIIYECSVRDMTSHPLTGTSSNRTFAALCEAGTSYKEEPTGLDYLSSLGVTHIQLQPVLDFATVDELNPTKNYNWGYDPVSLITLEGSYSLKPNQPFERMKEFRRLVKTLHARGLRVVLDLVWNHMYDVETSCLNLTVPYYYYRHYDSGYISNGSYCGNDLDSAQPMMRKLFLKAAETLIRLYNVDGFRFDLMGIIDIETMNEIVALTKNLKKDFLIYGEGWNMPTALEDHQKATITNQYMMKEVGHFNDVFRDVLKGKTSDDEQHMKGYLTGDLSACFDACSALLGHSVGEPFYKRFENPTQSINAIETHDNATAWDKMHMCCSEEKREQRQKRQKMMIACTLFAQGVPFLHAGIEFCGTKNDVSNSYMSGDEINGMNWQRSITNKKIIQYTKKCIDLRRREKLFRLSTEEECRNHVNFYPQDNGDLIYELVHGDEMIHVMINPSLESHDYYFGEDWAILLDEDGFSHQSPTREYHIQDCSVVVLQRR